MIVFTTFHTENYKDLSDLTFEQNKKKYCEKHGYPIICKTGNWNNVPIMYEKFYLLTDALYAYQNCEWVFYTDCDTLITNFTTRLEDFVKDVPENIHLIIGSDFNGVNAGNFFFRNSEKTRDFIHLTLTNIGITDNEQEFIMDAWNGSKFWKEHIDVRPQRQFNSYDFSIYEKKFGEKRTHGWFENDDGYWKEGDFLIHFVSCSNSERIQLIKDKFMPKIKYI